MIPFKILTTTITTIITTTILFLPFCTCTSNRLTLYQWPLDSPTTSTTAIDTDTDTINITPLGEIEYDPSTNTGTYTPFPTTKRSTARTSNLMRIGFWNKGEGEGKGGKHTNEFVSTVIDTSLITSNTQNPKPNIILHLDQSTQKPWHVEYTYVLTNDEHHKNNIFNDGDKDKSTPSSSSSISSYEITVISRPKLGPTPYLHKPIATGPDGKIPVPEVEKTFLQKYWWLILAGAFLVMGGGGGGGNE